MTDRKRIYLCLAHMSEDGAEQRYVKEAFDTNWVVPLGPNVNAFEKDLEEFVGVFYDVCLKRSPDATAALKRNTSRTWPGKEAEDSRLKSE